MPTEEQFRQFMAMMSRMPRQIALVGRNGERTVLSEGDRASFWVDTESRISMKVERGQDEYAFGTGNFAIPGSEIRRGEPTSIREPTDVLIKVFRVATGLAFERVVDEDDRQIYIVGRKQ